MREKIRAVQYGCGPIGCTVARLAHQRDNIELVGAVDIDPAKAGRDLGVVAGLDEALGVVVTDDPASLLASVRPDVVFHTTGSQLESVGPQIEELIRAGCNVVSTCEELSFPYRTRLDQAARLDRLARDQGVTVVATGINPGFLMDTWPLCMTAVCQVVRSIRAVRIQDATSRRLPFQRKIGAGLMPDAFQEKVATGTLRHVGLCESVAMIADGLGWELEGISESIEPVLATEERKTPYLTVSPGQAAGVRQVARGLRQGQEVIQLEFEAAVGTANPHDAVYITGTPDLQVEIPGGTHGDIGTTAVTVNAAHRVVEAPPGLKTMTEIPPVVCQAG